jgi:cytochrome P450
MIFRAMTQDPEVYPSPQLFLPERFLGEKGTTVTDPRDMVFGFGRR